MLWIRADGNAGIGAGHLMRCLAIAERAADGAGVCFVCADGQSAALAQEHGFQAHVLGTDYRDMESELPAWRRLMEEHPADGTERPVILVDSYHVTDGYLEALGQFGGVALLEDMGVRCYPADWIINYNAPAVLSRYQEMYRGRSVRLLIGSRYVPVRRQFLERPAEPGDYPGKRSGQVRNVLILAGGGDSGNIAERILERIQEPSVDFYLVAGRFNPHFRRLKELEVAGHGNLHICHDVKDMAGLMRQCDIALTAGGSTVYELSAMGVPFICFSCAENQEALVGYIGEKGIAGSAGAWHRDSAGTLDRLGRLYGELVRDGARRAAYSRAEREIIDGQGAGRLAEALGVAGK